MFSGPLDLTSLIILWAVLAAVVLIRHWGAGRGIGLVFGYVLTFGVTHWMSAVLYLLPWFPGYALEATTLGLRESVWAMGAFAVGSEVALWVTRTGHRASEPQFVAVDNRIANLYLVAGIVLYGVVLPVASRLPSATAFAAVGSTLVVVGMGVKCWNAWVSGQTAGLWLWLLASVAMPIVTVAGQGFLGYGFAAMLTVFAFVASFYRPRWRVVVMGLLLAYGGMSVYVTYMRDRLEIRSVVWSGGSVRERVAQLVDTFSTIEPFDIHNEEHLFRVDSRLNQDYLIGTSVAYLRGESTEFAHGATLYDALLALVPRALWPGKPVSAGSGDLVSHYTGITFAEGTSVGIGQVMESYVNFGRTGVIVDFLLIGFVVALLDRFAARYLLAGNAPRFLLWYMPGLSVLQIGGSFVEVTSSSVAALVMALLVNHLTARMYPDRRGAPRSAGADETASQEATS